MSANQEKAARTIEIALGIGINPLPNCDLCRKRINACPKHASDSIAAQLGREGLIA